MTALPMWLKHAIAVLAMMAAISLAGLAHGAPSPVGPSTIPAAVVR